MEVEATEQLSEVAGEPKATPVAEQPLLVVALTVEGQVIDGGVTSAAVVTVTEAVARQPISSVTVTK